MAITQGIMTNGNIRLGDFEMIMDFFSNPEEYEPDLSEVKVAINDKKPVEIVRKPVIKPKLTREGLINKFSLISTQKEIKDDNVINDDVIVNETDDFDFGDMDFDLDVKQKPSEEETSSLENDTSENLVDTSESLVDTSENLVDTSENLVETAENLVETAESLVETAAFINNALNTTNETVNGIEIDIDIDEETDEDMCENTEEHEITNGIEFDVDIDDFGDFEGLDIKSDNTEATKTNQVINGIEFDSDMDDFDDFGDEDNDTEDEDTLSSTNNSNNTINNTMKVNSETTKQSSNTVEKDEVNGIEIDIDLDDFGDDDDYGDITPVNEVRHTDNNVKQVNKTNITSPTSVSSSKVINNNVLEFDLETDDLGGLLDDIEDDEPTKETKSSVTVSSDSENKRLLAELERLKAENNKLKHESESNKRYVEPVKKDTQTKDIRNETATKKADILDKVCDTQPKKVNRLEKSEPEKVVGSKYDKYTVMNINALYTTVSKYMVSKGVQHKPIDINELNEMFGTENIKKLVVKQYLIKTKKGVTVGL